MVTSAYDASMYDSTTLDAYATSSSLVYIRDAVAVLDSELEDAIDLGTLTTNYTQLNVKSTLTNTNTDQYYKFTMDGDSAKLWFQDYISDSNTTTGIRVQLLDSSGKVLADSSEFASPASSITDSLNEAYAQFTSVEDEFVDADGDGFDDEEDHDGLELEDGESYYIHVTWDATSVKSVDQDYSLSLYSGDNFNVSYQTSVTVQEDYDDVAIEDNTMTYSLIDALEYNNSDQTHTATETVESAIDIGYLVADSTAIKATGQMTWVCDDQVYAFHLQDGAENLKLSFTNKTDTSELRVQVTDSTGLHIIADSEGTEEQQAAYEALLTSDGLEAEGGDYIIAISYKTGEEKSDQLYQFMLYSGDSYDALYETETTTETAATAILNGDLSDLASARTVAQTYLATALEDDLNPLFSYLKEYSTYL